MILGGKRAGTRIPVANSASLNVLCDKSYNPYFVWWWHNLYEYDKNERCIPHGCVFSADGCTFTAGNYIDDLHGRHLLSDGTLGKWSHIYLTEGEVPFFGSAAGGGTRLYLNMAGTVPKITGKIILYPEYCPSLTHLACQSNLISVLDVSALTSLVYLYCHTNSISVLDVSALTSLTSLNCSANSISVLDVSALTSLTYLNCSTNSISVLDVSALTSLATLFCSANSISVLDVSALTSLVYLYCSANSISVLDVSALTSLTTLYCGTNSMDQAMVDTVLCDVDGYGTNSGVLDISGNVAPSAAGITCKNNLIARGWTVTTD